MNIQKQVFDGDRLSLALLMGGDVTADDLDQVIQQQAEGKLKDGRFRSAADEGLQMEDFRDLLEYLLDALALPVVIEQILGRIRIPRRFGVFIATGCGNHSVTGADAARRMKL